MFPVKATALKPQPKATIINRYQPFTAVGNARNRYFQQYRQDER